jgi:ribosomal protein S27AE
MDPEIIAALMTTKPARCVNCGQASHLCFDQRCSRRWTCYSCGRIHSEEWCAFYVETRGFTEAQFWGFEAAALDTDT